MHPVNHHQPVTIQSESYHQKKWSFRKSCIGKIAIAIFHILTLGCFIKSSKTNRDVEQVTYQSQPTFGSTRINHTSVTLVPSHVFNQSQHRGFVGPTHVNPHAVPSTMSYQTHAQVPSHRSGLGFGSPTHINHHAAPNGFVPHNPRPTEVSPYLQRGVTRPTAPYQTNTTPTHNPRPTSVPFGTERFR